MDIVDQIMEGDLPKSTRILKLVGVSQLNYRAPLGDKAWDAVRGLTDAETVIAMATLVGLSGAKAKSWEKILG